MIHKYIEKIVENGNNEEMQELSEILEELMYKLKNNDPKCYHKYKMKLYELAYGKVLNEDIAVEWVESMQPESKWTMEETTSVKNQYGLNDISDIDFYVVLNMMYSDYHKIIGENVDMYVKMAKAWLEDSDVAEGKLYNYKMYVVD
jgi:hypothetical protein